MCPIAILPRLCSHSCTVGPEGGVAADSYDVSVEGAARRRSQSEWSFSSCSFTASIPNDSRNDGKISKTIAFKFDK